MTTRECIKTLLGHSKFVMCIEILTSNQIDSSSEDGTIRIWNTESGECQKLLKAHSPLMTF
jgi:WD40 repeat protein